MSRPPSRRTRVLLASLCGCAFAVLNLIHWGKTPSDFAQFWGGARALVAGVSPYQVVGPGRAIEWPWFLLYPATALVPVLPLGLLPLVIAKAIWVGVGFALFTYVVTARGYGGLWALSSYAAFHNAKTAQWAPLLSAAAVLPGMGGLLVAKPTVGLALLTYRPSRSALAGALAIIALSFALRPSWIGEWHHALSTSPIPSAVAGQQPVGVSLASSYVMPALLPNGLFLLAAWLRWRRSEARLLGMLALVPHTTVGYELLPLFLIPSRGWEFAILSIGTWVALGGTVLAPAQPTWIGMVTRFGTFAVWCVYLPALLMVLRRPNEGHVPRLRDGGLLGRRLLLPRVSS